MRAYRHDRTRTALVASATEGAPGHRRPLAATVVVVLWLFRRTTRRLRRAIDSVIQSLEAKSYAIVRGEPASGRP